MTTNINRVFTRKTILIGTLLGGPIIAGIMMSNNYKVFGNKNAANISIIIGILSTLLLFAVAFFIPDDIIDSIPNIIIPCIYTITVGWLLKKYQTEDIEQFIEEGGEKKSAWTAIGYTFVVLTFYIGIIATLLLVSGDKSILDDDSIYTEKISLGRNTDLYYSPDISENIVNKLANLLRYSDFEIEGTDIMFGDTPDYYELIFIVSDESSVYDPDFIDEFNEYEEYLNENMGLKKRIEIKFMDIYLERKYELEEVDSYEIEPKYISA